MEKMLSQCIKKIDRERQSKVIEYKRINSIKKLLVKSELARFQK